MSRNRMTGRPLRLMAAAALAISSLPALAPGRTIAVEAAAPAAASVSHEAVAALPSPPPSWPSTHLEIGLTDSPNGAADLHASGQYKFRYQYLAGGVNTGKGWSTWNANAKFADYYVDESVAVGMTPVFIYYQLLQSSPAGGDEKAVDLAHLKSTSLMGSYWADVTLLFTHLGAYSSKIVVDIEPDLWGYIQQGSTGDNGATVQAAVASSGNTDLTGLANNGAGFAQAFIRLRNKYAPNVMLGYELSMWGTLTDPLAQDIPLSQIDALAARSTAFQQSLGASFDLVFTDPADRDADFDRIIYGDGGNSWWSATDYQRFDQYVGDFVRGTGLRMVLWQIPLGNTKMRAMNNSWGHYQDNHVEWWFDDATGTHLTSTLNSGVIAMLFGGGADGTTAADDAMGDGTTNPAAINGNTRTSYSSDDDGGYFRHQANAYYAAGAVQLPGMDWTVSGVVGSSALLRGRSQSITVTVAPNVTASAKLDIELHAPDGSLVQHWAYDNESFVTGQNRAFPVTWNSGSGNAAGLYTVQAGISTTGGGTQLTWNSKAATFTLSIAGKYVPLTPTRLLDTRDGTGLSGVLTAKIARTFQVTGRAGVPANALAVTGNLTVTQQSARGFLYIGPDPQSSPGSSTLNFPKADDRANAVTVALSKTGTLSVTYAAGSGSTTHAIFDVTGYFTADGSGSTYIPLAPARLLDSRDGTGLSGVFTAKAPRTFQVTGRAGVPANATAVTGNLTVTQQSARGFLFIGPDPQSSPGSSSLNFPVRDNRANAVTVALGAGGTLSVTYAAAIGATTHAIFDVTGYFVPDASGSVYVALAPYRLLDSRDGTGLSGAFTSHVARTFTVFGRGGVPTGATAVTGNLTVTGQSTYGFLYIGPTPQSTPESSTLNFPKGDDRANAVTVALSGGGTLSVTYAASGGATTQVIFDVTGYFTR